MLLNRKTNWQRQATIVWAAATLGGCAVATPISIESSGRPVPGFASLHLEPTSDTRQAGRIEFEQALKQALAARDIAIDGAAPVLADYAVSIREARLGIAKKPAEGASATEPEWQSGARSNRLLDRCKALRLRATLVLFSRSSGDRIYRGAAETDSCEVSSADYARLASSLVEDALAQ